MPSIERVVKGSAPSLLEADKANEVIAAINGLANVKPISPIRAKVYADWSGFEIDLDIDSLNSKISASGGGGGVPEGFEEVVLEFVSTDNTAATGTFLINQGDS